LSEIFAPTLGRLIDKFLAWSIVASHLESGLLAISYPELTLVNRERKQSLEKVPIWVMDKNEHLS